MNVILSSVFDYKHAKIPLDKSELDKVVKEFIEEYNICKQKHQYLFCKKEICIDLPDIV